VQQQQWRKKVEVCDRNRTAAVKGKRNALSVLRARVFWASMRVFCKKGWPEDLSGDK
jgi:hypothetical protein